MNTQTDTSTALQKTMKVDTLVHKVYKATKRYSVRTTPRVIETEHGVYLATNDFMHGAEDGDLA